MSIKEDDYLSLSGIQHFAYCRRQWALIHIEQQWSENYQTTSGELMHKKAHDDEAFEKRANLIIARGLRISSAVLGLSGQCDVVEFHKNENGIALFGYDGKWDVMPIEYKNGEPKEGVEDKVQLCAQAICLEEMFATDILKGYLFYGKKKRRTEVFFSEQLREITKKYSREMHEMFNRGHTPKVKKSKRCQLCSLINECVPKLQKQIKVAQYIKDNINAQVNEED